MLALGGDRLVSVHLSPVQIPAHDPRPWLLIALLAGVAALAGWVRSERLRGRVKAVDTDRRREREEHERFARAWERQRGVQPTPAGQGRRAPAPARDPRPSRPA
ncbi:MAG TPA: hypothetical protein VLP43_01025 [Solirubrobacteraceae bacterium]|nr:hypothetical protein [Solirubrobacteraceae bacterium]